jgi:hypothetical protein
MVLATGMTGGIEAGYTPPDMVGRKAVSGRFSTAVDGRAGQTGCQSH